MNSTKWILSLLILFSSASFALSQQQAIDQWTYIQLDDQRAKFGDFGEPDWLRYFGLDMEDLNLDGWLDIASGRYVYMNPGSDMSQEWQEGTWMPHTILQEVDNGHTIDVIDFNNDGHLDIFSGEMRFGEGNPDSKIRILLGDGQGKFKETIVAEGVAVHESKILDLDGDGDLDVLGKPYTWKAPRLDMWLNGE